MATVKELFSHGKNYLIANIASKALAFISIPLFTRLLTPEDYGINGVFLGGVLILSSIYNLNLDKSISRYYYDQTDSDDFKSYIGTCYTMMVMTFVMSSILLFLFRDFFSELLGINKRLIIYAIPIVLINMIISSFEQIYQPQKLSRLVAKYSTIKIYLIFITSVPVVYFLNTEKYYGLIWGQILGGGIVVLLLCKYLRPYIKIGLNKKHLKYMFLYSIPLLPDALSGIILEQFGKISIGNSMGMASAGFYTLAISISSLVSIIVLVSNQAWVPYYFEYMNRKDYSSHDKEVKRIFILTVVGSLFISFFGKEIALLLAKDTYIKYLYLLPVLCSGYVFYQLFYVYYRHISYSRKTIYMSVVVISAGIINIYCNYLLVPIYKELGAAISFLISYIALALFAWLANKYIVKIYSTPLKEFALIIILYLIAEIALFYFFNSWGLWVNFIFRSILFGIFSILIIGKNNLKMVVSFCKNSTYIKKWK